MDGNIKSLGNTELVSNEEKILANYLRDTYLDKVNEHDKQNPVIVNDGVYAKYVKRALDLLIATPAFIITLPFNGVFAICTFVDVGRPIIFKQTRVGKDGKPFVMVKFRNMNNNTDSDGKLLPAKDRVTKFGRFMRKYSLDELLNFYSVVKGDMSIIGPRPLPEFFVDRMSDRHKMRHTVKPGLECPRIIPNKQEWSKYQNQFENDIWYVENVSFATDVKMVFFLIKMTFNMKSRGRNAEGKGYLAGYDRLGKAITLKKFKKEYPDEWMRICESN